MNNKINKFYIIIFSTIASLSCGNSRNEIEKYLGNKVLLKEGVVNKYYLNTISKTSYPNKTNIEYRYLKKINDSLLIQKRFNPAFELFSEDHFLIEDSSLVLVKRINVNTISLDTTISKISNSSFYLTLRADSLTYETKANFAKNFSSESQFHSTFVGDTMLNKKNAKIIKRGAQTIYRIDGKPQDTNYIETKEIYLKDTGLWSYSSEDSKNNYSLELVEEIALDQFENLIKQKTKRIGYIDRFKSLDNNKSFKLCFQDYEIKDYYNGREKRSQFVGGKKNLRKFVNAKLDSSNLMNESGFLTFRFIINCEGKAGSFVANEASLDYEKKRFHHQAVSHLHNILSQIEKWSPCEVRGQKFDSYCYITFILKNGKIEDILP